MLFRSALNGQANVFGSYRSHAAFLAQTGNTDLFFAELYGRITGSGEGKGGSMHLTSPEEGFLLSSGIVATQIPIAVGSAFANKRLNTGKTSVVFFGDGATDSGAFWESLNIAALYNLPMLFVCEDNEWAVDTKRADRQNLFNFLDAIRARDIDAYEDQSGDVESVYALTTDVMLTAKAKSQPVLISIKCCRYLEHVGIGTDWHWGYRDKDSVERDWISRDAVKTQRTRLLNSLTDDEIIEIENSIDNSIQQSVKKAEDSIIPSRDRLYTGVFYEKT